VPGRSATSEPKSTLSHTRLRALQVTPVTSLGLCSGFPTIAAGSLALGWGCTTPSPQAERRRRCRWLQSPSPAPPTGWANGGLWRSMWHQERKDHPLTRLRHELSRILKTILACIGDRQPNSANERYISNEIRIGDAGDSVSFSPHAMCGRCAAFSAAGGAISGPGRDLPGGGSAGHRHDAGLTVRGASAYGPGGRPISAGRIAPISPDGWRRGRSSGLGGPELGRQPHCHSV
jgi:hypothetical protein